MQVTVEVQAAWIEALRQVSDRMERGDDFEEVFGRSLALADVITYHLAEPGASVELLSPRLGPSTMYAGTLYGKPGLSLSERR